MVSEPFYVSRVAIEKVEGVQRRATLPAGVEFDMGVHGRVKEHYGIDAPWLAGIGFTMSLFIAGLVFGEGELLSVAKLAILVASIVACLGGMLILGRGRAPE